MGAEELWSGGVRGLGNRAQGRDARTPELACAAFAAALGSADPGAAAACFVPDGCLIAPDATSVHGRADICLVLIQLVALQTRVEVESIAVFEGAELALALQRWKITVQAPDGSRDVQLTDPTLVLRRIESEWKLAIAAPWGTGEGRGTKRSSRGSRSRP